MILTLCVRGRSEGHLAHHPALFYLPLSVHPNSELQNTNYICEKEFVEELKRLEEESVEAEAKLREVHGQKAKVCR